MKGSCGFPSPADDYASEEFNLNDFFVRKPHTTFVIEADGDSMIDAGISSGDILLVDSSKGPSTATSCSPISAARSRSSASSALTASLS